MKLHDVIVGLVFASLGVFVAVYAEMLTPPRNLNYGPGFFPMLIGIALALVGAGIALNGARELRTQPLAVRPEWTRSPTKALRFLVLPLGILFYVFAVEAIGFLATAFLILTTCMVVGGVSIGRAVIVGVAVALIVNIGFASLLHVPLAWGPLTPISGWFIW